MYPIPFWIDLPTNIDEEWTIMRTIESEMLIEARVNNAKKSAGVAYLLLLLVGMLGVHRYYLGRTGSGAFQTILFIIGILTFGILWIPLVIWLLVDLFLISGMVRSHTEQLRRDVRIDLMGRV